MLHLHGEATAAVLALTKGPPLLTWHPRSSKIDELVIMN